MVLDDPWVWLAAVGVGWVFLGVVAGRFHSLRAALGDWRRSASNPKSSPAHR